jgi:hypothetical protein
LYMYLVDFITSIKFWVFFFSKTRDARFLVCHSSCAHSLHYLEETSSLCLEYSIKVLARMKRNRIKEIWFNIFSAGFWSLFSRKHNFLGMRKGLPTFNHMKQYLETVSTSQRTHRFTTTQTNLFNLKK